LTLFATRGYIGWELMTGRDGVGPAQEDDFKGFCRNYFARLCRGYRKALDDTLVRAWLYGHKNVSDNGGALDMSARMFPALAAWLSDPTRPTSFELRGETVDVEEMALAILDRAFDPDQPGFWGRDAYPARDQRTVESSVLAYGAWLVRDTTLKKVSPRGLECFQEWLSYFSSAPLADNNWSLFWIANHTARKALKWDYDQSVIDDAWEIIHGYDRGDGWMTDGPEGYFDDYNWWVFGTHEMFWMQMDGESDEALSSRLRERIRERLEVYPHFFGSDGSVSEYGRSLSYKFARLGCPVLAYKLGFWPHSAGMLRRLVYRHLGHYDNLGGIDRRTDTMRQELSEFGHPAVRDSYINTGHPYWGMMAFTAIWQLDEADPIWTAEEDSLPVEKEDYQLSVKPAGWLVTGDRDSGQVQRHQLGTRHGTGAYAAKYGKFMYGSHFPANFGSAEGDFGPDSALCATDGDHWAHPGVYDPFIVSDSYLRAQYPLHVGEVTLQVESILVPHKDQCLRIHRVEKPEGSSPIQLIEGAAALGYAPGTTPAKGVSQDQPCSWALVRPRSGGVFGSLIRSVAGYSRAQSASGFRGDEHLNVIHDRAITPTLVVDTVPDSPFICACLTVATCAWSDSLLDEPEIEFSWNEDGSVDLKWQDEDFNIPSLGE
jgi:hypothetical protein